jgi:hypothetical protein
MVTIHELALAASINAENLVNGSNLQWSNVDIDDSELVAAALEEIADRTK